jgi:YD repeat-containing protein
VSWNGTPFGYDANGNLTGDGATTYAWDARDQLIGIAAGMPASFQYDGLGRRRTRTVGTSTTGFHYDGINLVQELSGAVPSANILTGLEIDDAVARTDATGMHSVLVDGLGSARERRERCCR